MVDTISTSLCIEAASPDVPSYAKAVKNVVSLLKPGGKLVVMGIFKNPVERKVIDMTTLRMREK